MARVLALALKLGADHGCSCSNRSATMHSVTSCLAKQLRSTVTRTAAQHLQHSSIAQQRNSTITVFTCTVAQHLQHSSMAQHHNSIYMYSSTAT
jgi:hypothetical protein